MRINKVRLVLLLVVLLALFASLPSAHADCYIYNDSHLTEYGGDYGAACSGTGGGCEQCYDDATATTQARVCTYDLDDPWTEDCYYFGPENQIP